LFFKCQQKNSFIKEVGLIEMDAEMKISPYKTLIKLSILKWDIFVIEDSSIMLSGKNPKDQKLAFYRIPIG
jgi:hypothetical protein